MLVVAVLYWAQVVLVPVSLAVLLTFVLAPPVVWLQRRIGRIAAVLTVVFLVFTFAGLAGWGVIRQMSTVGTDISTYRSNIRAKIADVRGAQDDAYFSKFGKAIRELQAEFGMTEAAPGTLAKPLVVTTDKPAASVLPPPPGSGGSDRSFPVEHGRLRRDARAVHAARAGAAP